MSLVYANFNRCKDYRMLWFVFTFFLRTVIKNIEVFFQSDVVLESIAATSKKEGIHYVGNHFSPLDTLIWLIYVYIYSPIDLS